MDLTGIGVRMRQFFDNFLIKKNNQKIQLHINSLSAILMYSNIQTVFRFMHVFTGRIKEAGALGIFVVDSGMHDDPTITTLKQLFDGVIEIKEENDKNYIRTVGLSSKPTPWLEYEVEGGKLRIITDDR
jgi:archaellum biogenesis ATPase FlaH